MSDGAIVACFGAPGSGKTTFGARVAIRAARAGRRVMLIDPTGDVSARMRGDSAHEESVPPEWVTDATDGAGVERATRASFLRKDPPRVVALRIKDAEFAAHTLHWVAAREWAREWVFLVDECEEVWPTSIPQGAAKETIKYTRNRGQLLIVTGQRPQYTSTILRSNATHVCVFKADSEQFVDYGCREFGSPKLFESAYTLKRHHYLYRAQWREDARAALPEYSAVTDPIPWP